MSDAGSVPDGGVANVAILPSTQNRFSCPCIHRSMHQFGCRCGCHVDGNITKHAGSGVVAQQIDLRVATQYPMRRWRQPATRQRPWGGTGLIPELFGVAGVNVMYEVHALGPEPGRPLTGQ